MTRGQAAAFHCYQVDNDVFFFCVRPDNSQFVRTMELTSRLMRSEALLG